MSKERHYRIIHADGMQSVVMAEDFHREIKGGNLILVGKKTARVLSGIKMKVEDKRLSVVTEILMNWDLVKNAALFSDRISPSDERVPIREKFERIEAWHDREFGVKVERHELLYYESPIV